MRIAATNTIREHLPGLSPIPSEPGYADFTVVLMSEWDESYRHRFRQLKYVVVNSLEEAEDVLKAIGYDKSSGGSSDRPHLRAER